MPSLARAPTVQVRHVQEARRLLRESIAKVDHDEVDVDVMGDDAMDDEINRAAAEAEAEAARAAEGGGDGGGGDGGGGDGAKRVKTCSYQKYKKVRSRLLSYMRLSFASRLPLIPTT